MTYWYKIITPDFKTAKKFGSNENVTPEVGDYARISGIDYIVSKVSCEHDYDENKQSYSIYLDTIDA
jgi:hypothetical protein